MNPSVPVCACFRIRRAGRAVTRFYEESLGPSGMGGPQFVVLRAISLRGPLGISELGTILGLDQTTVTRNVARLVRNRWLTVTTDPDDSRGKRVSLTPRGAAKFEEATPLWQHAQTAIRSALGADDLDTLFALLARIEVAAGIESPDASPGKTRRTKPCSQKWTP